jgi:hypothetical protein
MHSVYDELEGRTDGMVAYQACHLCHNGNKKARPSIQFLAISMWSRPVPKLSSHLTFHSARGHPVADNVGDVQTHIFLVYGL